MAAHLFAFVFHVEKFFVSLLGFSFQLWEDSFMVMKLVQLLVQPFHFR